jgi:MYXO-CTERM domain-containing protein
MYCRAGACRDACETGPDTRLCPSGEVCQTGECVPSSMATRDGGSTADAAVDGGRTDGGRPSADGASTSDADDLPIAFSAGRRGCQCSTEGSPSDPRGALCAVALGALVVARRRRRR